MRKEERRAKKLQRKKRESWKPSLDAFLVPYLAGKYVSSVVALPRKKKEEETKKKR